MIARCILKQGLESIFMPIDPLGKRQFKPDRNLFGVKKSGEWKVDLKFKHIFDSFAVDALYIISLQGVGHNQFIRSFDIIPSGGLTTATADFIYMYDGANFGLAWDKFPVYANDRFQILNSARNGFVEPLLKGEQGEVQELIYELKCIHENRLAGMEERGYRTYKREARTRWRMVIGMGDQNVFENNLTLHPVFGLPYIPGSTIKGRIRHYVIKAWFNNDEQAALNCEDFRRMFGTAREADANRGNLIFHDAYPINVPAYAADVMTVHYSKYYQDEGAIPANEWEDPNPIYFITVEQTSFRFSFSSKAGDRSITLGSKTWKNGVSELIDAILPTILGTFGMGAKTKKGYGKMNMQ